MPRTFQSQLCTNQILSTICSYSLSENSQPDGKKWKADHPQVEWNWAIQLLAVGFILLPTTLIGLSAYFFPPIPGTPLCWLPIFWTGLTFLSHLAIIVNIVIDYYQFPVKLYLKALARNL